MAQVQGKVALVTGASSGIGAAIVKLLVKEGLIVVGVARRLARLEELSKQLTSESGQFHYLQIDITKEEDIKRAFKFIKDKFGVLHVLVNNAGVARSASLSDGDTKLWREVVDTNLIAVAIATREAIGLMKGKGIEGNIIHINSILGQITPMALGLHTNIYSASKFGVTAMTEILRQELLAEKVKIRVTSICPGLVDTEILEASKITSMGKTVFNPETPLLQSEDVAETVLFLITRPTNVEITNITIRPLGEKI